jgi:hypothetical protein
VVLVRDGNRDLGDIGFIHHRIIGHPDEVAGLESAKRTLCFTALNQLASEFLEVLRMKSKEAHVLFTVGELLMKLQDGGFVPGAEPTDRDLGSVEKADVLTFAYARAVHEFSVRSLLVHHKYRTPGMREDRSAMRTDESRDVVGFGAANDNQLNVLVVCLEVMRGARARVDGEDGYIGVARHPTEEPAVEAIIRHFAWLPTGHTEREQGGATQPCLLDGLADDAVITGFVGHHDSDPTSSIQRVFIATDDRDRAACVFGQ